jgi:hypothetical protein
MKADFGAEYERYAIGNLRKIGYPNIVDADSLGLYGQASSRGGQNQTSVDAVDLDSQSFFEMKSGDIPTGNINKKFRNVRTDEGNFELLFKKKFKKSWAEAATPEELSQGKIWKTNPSAFDELFKKRSGFGWTNVLVGSDYNQAAKSGNKFIYLNPSGKKGPYMGMKETFQSLKQVKTFNSPETIPTSDIVNLLRSESERVVGKIGYPAKSKGFIPNFSDEQQETFEAPGTARIPLVSQMVGRFFTNVTTPVNYDLESKAKQLYETGIFGSLYSFITDTPSDEVKSGYKKGTYVADKGATEAREPVYRWMYGLEPQTDWQKFYVKNPDNTVSFNRETPEGKNLFNRAVLNAVKAKLEGDPTAHRHSVMSNYGYKIEDDKLKFFDRWDFDTHPGEQGLFDFFSSSKPSGDLSNPNSAYNQVNKDVTSGSFTGRLKNTIRAGMSSVTEPVNITGEIPLSELPKLLKEAGVLYKYKDKKGKTISEYPFLKDSNLINKLTSPSSSPLTAKFSKGHVPNFNSALKESIAREVSAGYSPSQVRVGFSKSLVTDFNPTGAGVYNTSEGSLPAAMQLAKNAGVNPKTKGMGMAFNGHVPNFAPLDAFDVTAVGLAVVALITQIKSLSTSFKDVNKSSVELVKQKKSEAGSTAAEIKKIKKQARSEFRNIDENLEVLGNTRLRTATGQFAGQAGEARLNQFRSQVEQLRQKSREINQTIATADAPLFSFRSLKTGGRLNELTRTAGPGTGLAISAGANIAGQFLREDQFTGKALTSGFSDVAQFAGVGAAFGPLGAAGGALVGISLAAKKLVDAKAEEALYKINKQLDITKDKSNDFSNASQSYVNSLEQIQSALNDPNTRPETLIKFQTSISEALNQIPAEFRNKVLQAGSDITKVSEAIASVNKELKSAENSLQASADILTLIKKNRTFLGFGQAELTSKDQEIFNRLFGKNINQEKLVKDFSTQNDFTQFIKSINQQLLGTTYGFQNNLDAVKKQFQSRGIFTPEIADAFKDAGEKADRSIIINLINYIEELGKQAFKVSKDSKLFADTLERNASQARAAAKGIRDLTDAFNNLNIRVANQVDIEKERATTQRNINRIQTEGAINLQRARVKSLLEQSSPFISEQQKARIQADLNLNEVQTEQSSKLRGVIDNFLRSTSDIVTKISDDLRNQILPELQNPENRPVDYTQQRNVFQQNLKTILPLVQTGLQKLSEGGNIVTIKDDIVKAAKDLQLKPEAIQLLTDQLTGELEKAQFRLAELVAQGKFDEAIQKEQNKSQLKLIDIQQRLSIAGGAAALNNTGTVGISELFDKLTELTSELRLNATLSTQAQKGSSTFKLLDTLTNELQLGRNEKGLTNFSQELFPLFGKTVLGRAEQIKEANQRARELTNVELIRATGGGIKPGGELEKQFNDLNNNALSIAFDQISSQLKLQNLGDYVDLLVKESQYLNQLTIDQNKILAAQVPDLNRNFDEVISSQVGAKLVILNENLGKVFNRLTTETAVEKLNKEIRALVPGNLPSDAQDKLLEEIKQRGTTQEISDRKSISMGIGGLTTTVTDLNVKNPNKTISDNPIYQGLITEGTIKSIKARQEAIDKIEMESRDFWKAIPFVGGDNSKGNTPDWMRQMKNAVDRNNLYTPPSRSQATQDLQSQIDAREKKYLEERAAILDSIQNLRNQNYNKEADQELLRLKTLDERRKIDVKINDATKKIAEFEDKNGPGQFMFSSEKGSFYEQRIQEQARLGRVDMGSILKQGTTYNQADFARESGETLKIFIADFKSGIGSAFSEAIKGTKSLKEAFANLFESLLNKLTDRAVDQLVNVAFGAAEKGFRNYAGGSKGGLMTPSGFVRGYNSGGLVTGGSGVRDDIPTMMNGGEFVIRKSSVNKYGEGFLSQLNQGTIPTRAAGGSFTLGPLQNEFVYNDPERPTSGEYQIDPRLSAFALTDENNPQNKLREDRFEQLDRYLIDRSQFERDKQKALSDYEAKVKGVFTQGLITAGAQLASAGAQIGVNRIGTPSAAKSTVGRPYQAYDPSQPNYVDGKASGGSIKDNVPALLMGGEYVMSQQAVRNYGTNFMNQLNNGSLPRFADGGLVPNSNGTFTTSTSRDQNDASNETLQDLLTAINNLTDTLSKDNNISQSEAGVTASPARNNNESAGMSVINNISVNVTPSDTSSSVETNNQNSGGSNNNQLQNSARLGELLRNKVVEVIAEQKRPGGLLYGS